MPVSAARISLLTLPTAFRTPLPPKRDASPSRSSSASNCPVEAPLGTAAVPALPSSSVTTASTVGFPRESMISRPWISQMIEPMVFIKKTPLTFQVRVVKMKSGGVCGVIRPI